MDGRDGDDDRTENEVRIRVGRSQPNCAVPAFLAALLSIGNRQGRDSSLCSAEIYFYEDGVRSSYFVLRCSVLQPAIDPAVSPIRGDSDSRQHQATILVTLICPDGLAEADSRMRAPLPRPGTRG